MTELLDARGVGIAPGDTAIYGFGVSRSVAMAEAVVLGEEHRQLTDKEAPGQPWAVCSCGRPWLCSHPSGPSLTPSGRVRLRVVRRSYDSGEKPVVDVAPDRLVVLKVGAYGPRQPVLPPSPLPTQAEEVREKIESAMASYTEGLRRAEPPSYWEGAGTPAGLADYHAWCARQLKQLRKKLRDLDG